MSVVIAGAERPGEKIKYKELSVNTVAFISCGITLTEVLAGATRGKKGSKGGGGRVRLLNVDTRRLSGLKYKLICYFQIGSGHGPHSITSLELPHPYFPFFP